MYVQKSICARTKVKLNIPQLDTCQVMEGRSISNWNGSGPQFCVTSNGKKLEMVANEMNLNTNLDLSRAYWIKK